MTWAEQNSKWEQLRKRAEKALRDQPCPAAGLSEADIPHILHELEVHQVELEIQSEELRLKNLELSDLLRRYADLYNKAPTGFVSLNAKGVIVEANETAADMLGLPKNRLQKLGFSHFVHVEDHGKYFEVLKQLNHVPANKARGELRLLGYSSGPFYACIEVVPFKNSPGEAPGWLVGIINISRMKTAEEALREACENIEKSRLRMKDLSDRLLFAQEEERKRISRELHDGLGQTLAAIKYSIESALGSGPALDPEEWFRFLERLIPTLRDAIEEVRNICSGLRPAVLDDFGIIAAVQWLCRDFGAVFPNLHIETSLRIDEKDVPEDLKVVIFRIIQEALNNVAKHSGAEWVDLDLVRSDGGIDLTIEDNGTGFDVSEARKRDRPGIGLAGMKERAELSGAALSIESAPGRGTALHARWALL